MIKQTIITILFLLVGNLIIAQKIDFEKLAQTPKDTTQYPLDYKILKPRLEYPFWEEDFQSYGRYITTATAQTQMSMTYMENDVQIISLANSILPFAQLDTNVTVGNRKNIIGTWRMKKFRSIRFNDSLDTKTNKYYRLPDVLIVDKSNDDAFAVITDTKFKIFAKEFGKTSFKKMSSGKYSLENNRCILMYKLSKKSGGVSQIGIDENGNLIINYPTVVERVKRSQYMSYYTIIDQYIYERVK